MQHYTTIEQSKKLVELGLNPDTADMHYFDRLTHSTDNNRVNLESYLVALERTYDANDILPCWSLGALINLMPSTICRGGETFTLRIYKDAIYHVCYKSHYRLDEIWFSRENLLDAAFEMVCWLLEKGYIKKGE